jgi:hypothetical protein
MSNVRCADCVLWRSELGILLRCRVTKREISLVHTICDCPAERDAYLIAQLSDEAKRRVVDEWLLSIVREVGDESSAYQAVADESGRQWVVELSALRMPRTAAVLGEECYVWTIDDLEQAVEVLSRRDNG